ncbi:MAG: hypothetical protein ACKOTZ_10195 [Chloroflexota bacterium]
MTTVAPGDARFRTRGQPAAVAAVARAVGAPVPPHAILLSGPRGSGKTTLALDLAAGLLCTDLDPARRPCRACAACRKVEHGNHPDVHRLAPDGAGEQVRLAQVQALVSALTLLPMEGRLRIAIVESAHRMNEDAQNALLKTLEEPVGISCIVLCADTLATILPTVVSRATRLRTGSIPLADVERLLVERGAADAPRARAAAVASGGLPGIALALAAEPEATIVAGRLARTLLDLHAATARTRLDAREALLDDGAALDTALRGGPAADAAAEDADDGADAAPAAASGRGRRAAPARPAGKGKLAPAERRRAVLRILATWQEIVRDLLLAGHGARASLRHTDLLEEAGALAPRLSAAELLHFAGRIDVLSGAIEGYASPELVLDHLLLAAPRPMADAA